MNRTPEDLITAAIAHETETKRAAEEAEVHYVFHNPPVPRVPRTREAIDAEVAAIRGGRREYEELNRLTLEVLLDVRDLLARHTQPQVMVVPSGAPEQPGIPAVPQTTTITT